MVLHSFSLQLYTLPDVSSKIITHLRNEIDTLRQYTKQQIDELQTQLAAVRNGCMPNTTVLEQDVNISSLYSQIQDISNETANLRTLFKQTSNHTAFLLNASKQAIALGGYSACHALQ